MSEQMRKGFEAAYRNACLNRPIPRFDPAVFAKDHCDCYVNTTVESAWWAWQASREALVIELPPAPNVPDEPEDAIDDSFMDSYYAALGMRHACANFIKAAGLKVTP